LAANADIQITVEPLAISVPVSRDELPAYAGYELRVQNLSGSASNQVVFGGSTQVLSSAPGNEPVVDPSLSSPFVESTGTCVIVTSTSMSCHIGALKAAGQVGSLAYFVLLFRAPGGGTQIAFSWRADHAANPGGPPPESVEGQVCVLLLVPTTPTAPSASPTLTNFTANDLSPAEDFEQGREWLRHTP
jgi:hypothetical protein